ncbi:MAG: hypothetical protein COT33_01525 [Candidatus Nealsonbacteria bacterium CG08_land_8_20_14_0_20_38_20]|uniref:Nmd3 N-terminal domain-containing protein n=1 Tax=Candidatus Nealsonbacteria bacterium CG08_land_8_20_14_0_20_38_20 TaxID=1974705 RepID=A0A2H0YLZ1_9BACT|nr:MAG: hypothetical protein COT33_01525 [Candidatus Nealsonbacteria bacterium CG08_land_8_20_14_0_20_38_20]
MKPYSHTQKGESQIKGRFKPPRLKVKKEEAEFGAGKTNILICKTCGATYFYKSWRHRLEDYSGEKSKDIKFTLCPACQMIMAKKFEGEIILENVPDNFKKDIKKLAENFGKRAFEADPMDRVISITEERIKRAPAKEKRGAASRKDFEGRSYLRILTTENQLARRLAKKINDIFGRKLELSISQSHREDTSRIRINFEI